MHLLGLVQIHILKTAPLQIVYGQNQTMLTELCAAAF